MKKLPYIFAVGRRKGAVARVRLYKNEAHDILINERSVDKYFPQESMRKRALAAYDAVPGVTPGKISIKVAGGGISGQADAVRLGLARIFLAVDPTFRALLKTQGLLTRDARVKERKKPGLKRARRAPQWQKR